MVKGKESHAMGDSVGAKTEAARDGGAKPSALAHDVTDFNVIRTDDILTSEDVDFKGLLLPDFIMDGLTAASFHKPSPIQLRSIPLLRLGFDLIVQSKAGTGKTLVIALAALETVKPESKRLQAIVVAPTREIALQTKHFISIISSSVAVRSEAFIGGTSIKEDKKNTLGCQVAIGTPGRLNSLIESGDMSLSHVRLFVLDEADKLMEKSIFSQIRSISKSLPDNKQTILCSATFLHPLKDYVVKHMKEPFWVTPERAVRLQPGNLEHQKSTSTVLLGVQQFFKEVPNHTQIVRKLKFKLEEILEILSNHPFTQCIIFSNYQTRAETICHQLVSNGWPAMSVRGQDEQSHRTATLNSFKELQSRILLTTDVMSRGVDFRGVDLVVNLDIPYDSATYLHRMGRAGRFGSYGCVITLASTGAEVETFKKLLAEIDGTVVYTLPSDLSHIKQANKLKNVFFGSPKESADELVTGEDLDLQIEKVIDNVVELKIEDSVSKNLKSPNGLILEQEEDTRSNIASGEPMKPVNGRVVSQMEPSSKESSKASPFTKNQMASTKELKESSPPSVLSSAAGLDCNVPTSSKMLPNGENRPETSVHHAAIQLSEALCVSKHPSSTFCSIEDLEEVFSSWSLGDKKSEIQPPVSEENFKYQDWWPSANIVLTAANIQLQELKENALKPAGLSEAVKCELVDSSSDESLFQAKKSIRRREKKKTRRMNVNTSSHHGMGSSSHQKEPRKNITSAAPEDTAWLWDDSSNLYYIWDESHFCYYLYNPELNCSFKWEPEPNKYYKWDAASEKYKLWNCESGQYYNTSGRMRLENEAKFSMGHSNASSPRNLSDQNYLDWFAMWNKQVRQMSSQVYQAEYFKNLFGKFHNS